MLFQGTCRGSATKTNKTGPSFYTSSLLINYRFQVNTLRVLMKPEIWYSFAWLPLEAKMLCWTTLLKKTVK